MRINSDNLNKILLGSLILLSSLICLFFLNKIQELQKNQQIIIPKQDLETKNEDELKENLEKMKIKFIAFHIEKNLEKNTLCYALTKVLLEDNEINEKFADLNTKEFKHDYRKGIGFYEDLENGKETNWQNFNKNEQNDIEKKWTKKINEKIKELLRINDINKIASQINNFFNSFTKKLDNQDKNHLIKSIKNLKFSILQYIFAFEIQIKILDIKKKLKKKL